MGQYPVAGLGRGWAACYLGPNVVQDFAGYRRQEVTMTEKKDAIPADSTEIEDLELSADEANVHGGATSIAAPGQAGPNSKR